MFLTNNSPDLYAFTPEH